MLTIACGDDPIGRSDAALDALALDGGVDAGDTTDGGVTDAPAADSAGMDASVLPDVGPTGPVRYPVGALHSPISANVGEEIRAAVAADRQVDVFAKVGDSITVSTNYLRCFGGDRYDLVGRPLADTLQYYRAGDAAGTDPYRRESSAAVVGWHAGRVIAGAPSALDSELAALRPAVATVMYGTNDIGITGLDNFASNLFDVVDTILASGAVPIVSSIPARVDSASADADVPRFNLVARAIAQTRQVPFVDLHMALDPLPNRGLGGDNLHPSSYSGGACVLTDEGLRSGYNMRNLVTLEALDRVRRTLGGETLDEDRSVEPLSRVDRTGTHAAPLFIDSLPYVHGDDTTRSTERRFNTYDGCGAAQNEGGPEIVYRLNISSPTTVRVRVFDRGDVDVDVHLLSDLSTASCIARDHMEVSATLPVGLHYIVVDTWVGDSERGGEYLLVVDSI